MAWRFNNVKEAYDFLEERNKYGSKLGLRTMDLLLNGLQRPDRKIPIIHIAGTNGKGSVGAYLTAIYRQARGTAFHFASPAVFSTLDAWNRNGLTISEKELIDYSSSVYRAVYQLDQFNIHPTRFEVETAIAIYGATHYYNNVLILETGLGGADDATNVIEYPKICVFTNIDYDHMQYLGKTLTEIATVKAGIIKPACEVYSAQQDPEVKAVLDEKMVYGKVNYVDNSNLELISMKPEEMKFKYKGEEFETPLVGICQMQNAALAIDIARGLGFSEEIIKRGVKEVIWRGRFQVLSKKPYFIIDGAHNVDAVRQLAATIENCFTNQKVNFIIGVLKDKEYKKMMEIMMPYANRVYTLTPPNKRALDGSKLAKVCEKWHDDVTSCASVEMAVALALENAEENKCPIIAFGSLSFLGKLKECHDNWVKK